MTCPNSTRLITRHYLGDDDEAVHASHDHVSFTPKLEGLVLHVPLLGLDCPTLNRWQEHGEWLGKLSLYDWRRLENRRYRDTYEQIIARHPRTYLLVRASDHLKPGEGKEELLKAESALYARLNSILALKFLAFLVHGDGSLVPHRYLPITLTDGEIRERNSFERLRFYSWVMHDFKPVLEAVSIEGQSPELQELPIRRFDGNSLKLDEVALASALRWSDELAEHRVLNKLSVLADLANTYSGARDPSRSSRARLTRLIMSFEYAFGPFSRLKIERTHRRLATVFAADPMAPELPSLDVVADVFRQVRNSIAHGREVEPSVKHGVLSVLDTALRLFFKQFGGFASRLCLDNEVVNFRSARIRFFHETDDSQDL